MWTVSSPKRFKSLDCVKDTVNDQILQYLYNKVGIPQGTTVYLEFDLQSS